MRHTCGAPSWCAWTRPLRRIFLDSCACTVFRPNFQGSFWKPYGVQNGSYGVPLEILRSLLSIDIKFAWIGVRTENLWLLEVGSSELFFAFFRRRFRPNEGCYRRTESCVSQLELQSFSRFQACGSTIRNLRTKAVVREEKRVRFSTCFPYFR